MSMKYAVFCTEVFTIYPVKKEGYFPDHGPARSLGHTRGKNSK